MRVARVRRDTSQSSAAPGGRERVLQTAYDLFCRHGIRAIGVDRIAAEAGVTKMTLYRHFRSKDELVVAALDLREQLWTSDWLKQGVERRVQTARERLLAIFDLFDEWFRRDDYEGCFFNNSLLEIHDTASPIRIAVAQKRSAIRAFLRGLAQEAGARDPDELAGQLHALVGGAILAAQDGDVDAAIRARSVAAMLLERETAGNQASG